MCALVPAQRQKPNSENVDFCVLLECVINHRATRMAKITIGCLAAAGKDGESTFMKTTFPGAESNLLSRCVSNSRLTAE